MKGKVWNYQLISINFTIWECDDLFFPSCFTMKQEGLKTTTKWHPSILKSRLCNVRRSKSTRKLLILNFPSPLMINQINSGSYLHWKMLWYNISQHLLLKYLYLHHELCDVREDFQILISFYKVLTVRKKYKCNS